MTSLKKKTEVGGEGSSPSPKPSPTPTPFPDPIFLGERVPSIIPPAVTHVVMVTGMRGQGKTVFSLGVDNPANILMLDYESKGEGFAGPLGVGTYFSILDDCADLKGMGFRPLDIYNRTLQIFEQIPKDRFTAIVLDNAGNLLQGCLAEVQRNPISYGIDPSRALSGQYGGAWPGVQFLIKSLFNLARSRGVQVVVTTFQPTAAWSTQGPLINKFKITDVKIFHEMSVLTLVLVPGLPDYIPAPSALVMKEQLASLTWDDEAKEMIVKRRLPAKLPKASFSEVYKYLTHPADLSNPRRGETVTVEELAPWSPTFGKEQLAMIEKLAAAAKLMQEEGEG